VGVHAQRDRGVGMAEPGGDQVHRDACQQQGRGMDVSQIMRSGSVGASAAAMLLSADSVLWL
jgi:hypothetical protein